MANILSEIVDRKREAVAQLRADPASRDFRDRALAITGKCGAASIVASARVEPRSGQNYRGIQTSVAIGWNDPR